MWPPPPAAPRAQGRPPDEAPSLPGLWLPHPKWRDVQDDLGAEHPLQGGVLQELGALEPDAVSAEVQVPQGPVVEEHGGQGWAADGVNWHSSSLREGNRPRLSDGQPSCSQPGRHTVAGIPHFLLNSLMLSNCGAREGS